MTHVIQEESVQIHKIIKYCITKFSHTEVMFLSLKEPCYKELVMSISLSFFTLSYVYMKEVYIYMDGLYPITFKLFFTNIM